MLFILIYLFEVSALISVMYLFYRYLYFKLTYFEWSRYFFYGALILSLTIPLLPEILSNKIINYGFSDFGNTPYSYIGGSFFIESKKEFSAEKSFFDKIPIILILFVIWISGLIRYLFLFIRKLISLLILIKKSETEKKDKFIFVKTNSESPAFSFFNYIFINNDFENLTELEQNQIIKHEKLHVEQLHTLDNLIFEIFVSFFWFNPVSKKIINSVKEIHEFIVDNRLTENKNKPDYSRLILKLVEKKSIFNHINNFSKNEIINRIKLISNPESEKIRRKRFIVSMPVLFSVIFAFLMFTSLINSYAEKYIDNKKPFIPPFEKGKYQVISPYFIDKKPNEIFKNQNKKSDLNIKYLISHPEITYKVESNTPVLAVANGIVKKTDTVDNWGVREIIININLKSGYECIYKNIYKATVKQGDTIKQGEQIGITGDIRLYPTISFRLLKNNQHVNPVYCY